MTRNILGTNVDGAVGIDENLQKELYEILNDPDFSLSLERILLDEIDDEAVNFACHQWVAAYVAKTSDDNVTERLFTMGDKLRRMLDETDLLTKCSEDERMQLEDRLSSLIEQIGYYLTAVETVDKDGGGAYVEEILDKLGKSGYVYHPRKRLSILLCLFIVSPRLMETYVEDMLMVLRSHDIVIWARHPFGLLWMKILSHYILHVYQQTDLLATDEKTQRTMVVALETLERICERVGTDAGLFDRRLNHALLLRLCSQMQIREPAGILDRAIDCLTAVKSESLHTGSLQYDDADYIANLLESKVKQSVGEGVTSVGRFYTDRMELCIGPDSITLTELNTTLSEMRPLLPGNISLWRKINVNLNGKLAKDLRGKNDDSLDYYSKIWRHAEDVLSTRPKQVRQKLNLQTLGEGEGTDIIVCQQKDDFLFECRIVEEGHEGTGLLNVKGDVVPYYPTGISTASFWYNGQPLVLEAYVKAVKDDGTYEFAMIDNIRYDICEWSKSATPDTRLHCILNNRQGNAERAPGISEEGFPMFIAASEGQDISELRKGRVVEVGAIEDRGDGCLNATCMNILPDGFDRAESFHKLMLWYSDRQIFAGDEPSEEAAESGESPTSDQGILEQRHVEELLSIIDAMATIESDYKKAYHYLSFCRLVSVLLHLDERRTYFTSRLELLELLDHFATNGRVDEAKVRDLSQRYENILQRNPALRHDVERLQIISCLNSEAPDDLAKLFHWSGSQSEPVLQQLASLVLSHNYVRKAGLITQSEEIRRRIYDLLSLSRAETTKQRYGREDFHTEFKTSIVYPPNAMVPNLAGQMHNILRVICGFLNAEGGKLYIGVNDQGYETGIEEDLKFHQFNHNPSAYQAYIENSIVEKMSQEAGHCTRTSFVDESCNVLLIEIDPCPHPIKLEGYYYERMGSSTRKLKDDYLKKFLDTRQDGANNHHHNADDENITIPAPPTPPQPLLKPEKNAPSPSPHDSILIATAPRRNNALHEYEEGFESLSAIICMMDECKYKIIDDDDWAEHPLKLAVHESEREGWLIIVYENAHVAKIPVADLLDRERGRTYSRFAGSPAVFASIATNQDTLALCTTDDKGRTYIRFDDIAGIDEGKMQVDGKPLFDLTLSEVSRCDILPTNTIPTDISRNATRKSRGTPVTTEKGKHMMEFIDQG